MATEGRYSRVKSRFWTDEKARLWPNEAKFLALYLLTCPHGNILGCFVLPKLYICADLQWTPEQLQEPFAILLRDGFIQYDDKASLALITNWLKHNPIENGNQATAATKVLDELPNSPLFEDLIEAIKHENKPHLQVLLGKVRERISSKALPEPLDEPFRERFEEQLPKQNGKPVTVSVTVTETVVKDPSSAPDGPTESPQPSPFRSKRTFADDSAAMALARRLRSRILENLPNARVPPDTQAGLQPWCREFDLMMRVDGRSPPEVKALIDWCQADPFWRSNILSPGALRKQYDRLVLRRQDEPGNGGKRTAQSIRDKNDAILAAAYERALREEQGQNGQSH